MSKSDTPIDNGGTYRGFRTLAYIEKELAEDIISQTPEDELIDVPESLPMRYLSTLYSVIEMENKNRPPGAKLKYPKEMSPPSIASFVCARGDVCIIAPAKMQNSIFDDDDDAEAYKSSDFPIGVYIRDGTNRGVYEICVDINGALGKLIAKYNPAATRSEKLEVIAILKTMLPVKNECSDIHLIPVGNGIFDYSTQKLHEFSPEFIFTSKARTFYNPFATNPIFILPDGTTWDIESGIDTFAGGNPELRELLWEILQASVTARIPRNKMVCLYSELGNNGKGTLCALIRTLIGENRTISIPISDFSEKFALGKLPQAVAIVCDENDTNHFSDSNQTLKSLITGDPIRIAEKFQPEYLFRWSGLIVECINAILKIADKSGSFLRRTLIVPMPSCFTGREYKQIKTEFIHDRALREYVLYKVLSMMPIKDSFSEPDCVKEALIEFKMQNNNVHAFCEEMLPKCVWDLLPSEAFLYPLYKEWLKRYYPSTKPLGKNTFIKEVKMFVNDPKNNSEFEWTNSTRSRDRMVGNEPLLKEYNIRSFADDTLIFENYSYGWFLYVKEKYSGLKRIVPKNPVFNYVGENPDEA